MRVYKPTYSKPLPEKAKTFVCKQGKDKGKLFAKFKDAKGHTTQARLTKAGDKILVEVKCWQIEFEDHLSIRRQLKAYTNERATKRLADKIEELLDCKRNNRPPEEELCRWFEGLPPAIRNELIAYELIDAGRAAIGMPISEHVREYTDHLAKKERSEQYVNEVRSTLIRVFTECGFVTWSDISARKLRDYIDGLRDGGEGVSKRRYNGLLGAVKSFCKWMVKQQRATSSPIEYLDGMDNQQTDSRHPRRVLELNDFRRFLEAALMGLKKYALSGYERNLLYRFTAETGLRSIDIRRLRKRDVDFKGQKITVRAGRTKNKTDATVYLKPATATELQQYCATKLPHAHIFYLTKRTAMMVKYDLRNAGIPYCENGEFFDFHSLRHQCASLLAMNPNTSETVRQQALRHKTPAMTRHYSHAFEDQQREAIESLPDLTQPSKESQAAVRTGTNDGHVTGEILSKSCFGGASIRSNTGASGKHNLDIVEKTPLCLNNEGMQQRFDPLLSQRVTSR